MSLGDHLVAAELHGSLPFHTDCPVCRSERLLGRLDPSAPGGRRAVAATVAGIVVGAAVSPALAVADEYVVQPPVKVVGPSADPGDGPIEDDAAPAPGEMDDGNGPEDDKDADDELATPPPVQGTPGAPPAAAVTSPPSPPPAQPASPPAQPGPGAAPAPPSAPAPPPPQAAPPADEDTESDRKRKSSPARGEKPASAPAPGGPAAVSDGVAERVAPSAPPPGGAAGLETASPGQSSGAGGATGTRSAPPPRGGQRYTVKPGDSLWSIAQGLRARDASPAEIARLVDQIWQANTETIGTGSPSLIHPGDVLALPGRG